MKDWKAECERLRGQLKEVERSRDYYHTAWRNRCERDEAVRDKLKELLIEVLGK